MILTMAALLGTAAATCADEATLHGHWTCNQRPCAGRALDFDEVAGRRPFHGAVAGDVVLGEGAQWTLAARRLEVVSAGGRRYAWVVVRLEGDELVLLDEYESALLTFRRLPP
ncbi:MAG: hypothetical protein H6977_08105 [Gammaproteobacteria bacterium]|nr:hypothetical protein [Gammaproteobacteria bacterium]MCP5199961.1 hypothetical protein [Gammaproteobacteria bacterium]